MAIRCFPAARNDIRNALKWSAENFGQAACQRYKVLIDTAIADIANPELPHSYEVCGLQPGIRLYHLKHSRTRAAVEGKIVRKPRHFIVFTVLKGDTIIVRVLHDRVEIDRQLEEGP